MPNTRGIFILKILETIRINKNITLDDLKTELSNNDPFMNPKTSLKLINELSKGIQPKIKINEDWTVCLIA